MPEPNELSIGGQALLSAEVSFPRRGAWTVEAEIGAARHYSALSGSVTVVLPGYVSLTGTVSRSGLHAGRGKVHVTGGAGGFATTCTPRQYRNTTAKTVLQAILGDGSESLSTTAAAATTGYTLAMWTIPEVSVGQALDELTAALGVVWRVLDDGTVWVGAETWSSYTADTYHVVGRSPGSGTVEIAPRILDIRPGVTFEGQHLAKVVYHLGGQSGRRATCYLGDDRGGLDDTIRRVVTEMLAAQAIRNSVYSATVISQDSDGNLQVRPDSSAIPAMAGLPISPGLPGATITVPAGARCFVRFADGDPSRPEVVGWETGTALTLLELDGDTVAINPDGGTTELGDTPANAVARVADVVQISMALVVPDPTKGIALTSPVGPVTGTIGTPALPAVVVGQILTGKAEVVA